MIKRLLQLNNLRRETRIYALMRFPNVCHCPPDHRRTRRTDNSSYKPEDQYGLDIFGSETYSYLEVHQATFRMGFREVREVLTVQRRYA